MLLFFAGSLKKDYFKSHLFFTRSVEFARNCCDSEIYAMRVLDFDILVKADLEEEEDVILQTEIDALNADFAYDFEGFIYTKDNISPADYKYFFYEYEGEDRLDLQARAKRSIFENTNVDVALCEDGIVFRDISRYKIRRIV